MSDASDAVAEAMALTRQIAARHHARRIDLEAELSKRRADRADLEGDSRPEAQALARDLDARIAALSTDLGAVKTDLAAAVAEMKELHRMAGKALSLEVQEIVASIEGDPVMRTAEQTALDNVRAHLKDLESEARVNAELAGADTPPAAIAVPEPAKPSREEADAKARSEFEALRAGKSPKKTL